MYHGYFSIAVSRLVIRAFSELCSCDAIDDNVSTVSTTSLKALSGDPFDLRRIKLNSRRESSLELVSLFG